ncbi:MAG: hypothetical protein ACTSWP_10590, partial [Candidatus Freyarchaeota archaeon]
MARGIFRVVECWSYDGDMPKIDVVLVSVDGRRVPEKGVLRLNIDTGFSGSILLTRRHYEMFMLGELPESAFRVYRTLTGEIVMRRARATLTLPKVGVELETFVETPRLGEGKLLAGREVINKIPMLLNGPEKTCCYVS